MALCTAILIIHNHPNDLSHISPFLSSYSSDPE